MATGLTSHSRLFVAAISASLALVLAGCPWWPQDRQPGPTLTNLDPPPSSPRPGASEKPPGATSPPASGSTIEQLLAKDAWARTAPSLRAEASPDTKRWQHYELEELLLQPEPPRRQLQASLQNGNPVVAANAAIALARMGDPTVADRLVAVVRIPTLKLPIRCAAIEALASLDKPRRPDLLRDLLAQYGQLDKKDQSHYIADLHAELLHGLGRLGEPSDQPRLVAALRSPSADVRLEALRALGRLAQGTLPVEAPDLRTDPDARIRATCLGILAQHGDPDIERHLGAGLEDYELRVRIAAVAALATLKTDSARTTLRKLLGDSSELIRAAAVTALAAAGDWQAVLDTSDDKSWRVRVEVAKALGTHPDHNAALVIRKYLSDPSTPVEQQAVQSLTRWPLEQAGPILLEAMGRPVYTTRKASAQLLAERWPPARQFSADAPAERRSEILGQLEQQFRQQIGFVDPKSLSASGAGRHEISSDAIARVELLLRQLSDRRGSSTAGDEAAAQVRAMGTAGMDALEKIALERNQVLPPFVYHSILPSCDPVFAPLDRMTASEIATRRRAASSLAEMAAKRPLRPLAVARLAELVATETDPLVWQNALTAVATDASDAALRMAAAAGSHPSPEVRRRACEYLAAHPAPSHESLLAPALKDENEEVVIAAARALGQAGRMEDPGPLRQKLGASNESIQAEAAIALAHLGDPSGVAAMERLSYSGNEDVRRRIAAGMGEVSSPTFVPILIRLLDDRQSVRVTALAALPKAVGQDVASKPGEPAPRMAENVDRWKRWFQDR